MPQPEHTEQVKTIAADAPLWLQEATAKLIAAAEQARKRLETPEPKQETRE